MQQVSRWLTVKNTAPTCSLRKQPKAKARCLETDRRLHQRDSEVTEARAYRCSTMRVGGAVGGGGTQACPGGPMTSDAEATVPGPHFVEHVVDSDGRGLPDFRFWIFCYLEGWISQGDSSRSAAFSAQAKKIARSIPSQWIIVVLSLLKMFKLFSCSCL